MSIRNPSVAAHQWRTRFLRGIGLGGILISLGCHGLLDVSNPTLVQDSDIANAAGANARRLQVSITVNQGVGSLIRDVALFTDEWSLDANPLIAGRFVSDLVMLDRRDSQGYEKNHTYATGTNIDDPHLGGWDRMVSNADIAIPQVQTYTPDSLKGDYLAQLFAIKGFAIVQMAEDICSGFPINEVENNLPVFVAPYTTDSSAKYAIVQLDSAIRYAKDSTRFLNFARVVRGRAFLDLGQYDLAAQAVADVPTDFVYETEGANGVFQFPSSFCRQTFCQNRVVADREGGVGLPFVSAHDPRTPVTAVGVSILHPTDSAYFSARFSDINVPVPLATGIEARLIEAEVELHQHPESDVWFTMLNALRKTVISPAMDTIAAIPATAAAQVDLLYSERAFWLYLTGHRLGDLRRLIKNYGRGPETVFPTGTYPLGGTYQGATSIPFMFATESAQNPKLTSGCTVR